MSDIAPGNLIVKTKLSALGSRHVNSLASHTEADEHRRVKPPDAHKIESPFPAPRRDRMKGAFQLGAKW